MVTDKMVDAFANSFWPTSSEIVIDRNGTYIRAALEAALTASGAEPVAFLRPCRITFLSGEERDSLTLAVKDDARAFPVYAVPPTVAVKALAPADVYKVLRSWLTSGSLNEDHLATISREISALVSPADTSPVFTVAQIVEKIKDYGQDSMPTSEYRLACDDLVEAFEALAAAPKEASRG